jgi:DUF917 family protein
MEFFSMPSMTLKTIQDCEDLLEGSLWLATGGGGSFQEGLNNLQAGLEDGLSLGWQDAKAIPDDQMTATIALHGPVAPPSKAALEEIKRMGLEQNDRYISQAVKELESHLGQRIGAIVPCEVGADSMAIALLVGAQLGIPVVDGDYTGRAMPSELQATYCLYEKECDQFASVDRWGNTAIVRNIPNYHMLERLAKMLAMAGYGLAAIATAPFPAIEMKEVLVHGTLTRCLEIGRALRQARETDVDVIEAGLKVCAGWRLFEGQVVDLELEERDGYGYGNIHIDGSGEHEGQKLRIWFKNENHVSWLNGIPLVCSPDILTLVHRDNGRGVYNAEIAEGDEVVAIGMKGVEAFRTEAGLKLAGPEHFGFDIEYVPIENLGLHA